MPPLNGQNPLSSFWRAPLYSCLLLLVLNCVKCTNWNFDIDKLYNVAWYCGEGGGGGWIGQWKHFFLRRTSLRFENSVNQFAISYWGNQGLIPKHRWDWRFYGKLPTSKVPPIKLDRNPSQLITFRILWKHKIYANVTHCLLKFYLLASPKHVGVC